MHVPLSVRQCLTVSAAPGCRGDLHTFCCFQLSRNVAYSLFPCTPPWASYTARNEQSCHSRQSSVFPLSECAINQGFWHTVGVPPRRAWLGGHDCAKSRASINVP